MEGVPLLGVIVDPPGEPAANMAADERLAREVCEGGREAALRVYRWSRPAVSIGRRQDPDELPRDLLHDGFPIVRRPTGGGAVLHRPDELTYALALPRSCLPEGVQLGRIPEHFHGWLRELLVERGLVAGGEIALFCSGRDRPSTVCFSAPVCGDLLFQGRKVAGAALRIWRGGLLAQGTIQGLPLAYPDLLEAVLESMHRSFDLERALRR